MAADAPVSASGAGADALDRGAALFPRFEFSIDLKQYLPDDDCGAYSYADMVACVATQAYRSAHRLTRAQAQRRRLATGRGSIGPNETLSALMRAERSFARYRDGLCGYASSTAGSRPGGGGSRLPFLRCYIRLGDERAAWLEDEAHGLRPGDCAGRDDAPAPGCLQAQAALGARRLEVAQKKARPDLTRTSGLQDDFAGFLGSALGGMNIADRRLLDYRAALCGVQATGSHDPFVGPATAGQLRCVIRLNSQHAAHLAELSDFSR